MKRRIVIVLLSVVGTLATIVDDLPTDMPSERQDLIDATMDVAENYFLGPVVAFFYRKPPYRIILEEILFKLHERWKVLLPSKALDYDNLYSYDGGVHNYLHCFFIIPIRNDSYAKQINSILYSSWNMDYSECEDPFSRFIVVVNGQISRNESLEALRKMYEKGDESVVILGVENGIVTAFTLFPFGKDGNNCPENSIELTLLSQWNGTSFDPKINFFPKKIPLKFNGCKIPVSTVKYAPMMFADSPGEYDGLDYIMVEHLVQHLNGTLDLIYYDHFEGWVWFDSRTGVAKGSLTDVRQGKAWMTVSGVSNNLMHYRVMYSPIPYTYSRLVWYFPNPRPVESWKLLYLAFGGIMWIAVFITTLVCPIVFSFLARFTRTETFFSKIGCSFVVHWALTVGNCTGNVPTKGQLRILFTAWFFYTIHLNNAYTASLTGLITGGKLEPKVQSIDEIIERGDPTFLIEYLYFGIRTLADPKVNKALSKRWVLKNHNVAIENMITYRNSCILDNEMFIDYLVKKHKYTIYKVPVPVFTVPMGVMLRRNHFMFNRIRTLVLRLMSAGIHGKLVADFTEVDWVKEGLQWSPIDIGGLAGPFLILVLGYLISSTAFLVEALYYFHSTRRKKNEETEEPSTSARSGDYYSVPRIDGSTEEPIDFTIDLQ